MITEERKRALEDVGFSGWFVRLAVTNPDDARWLNENGTYFPHEDGWFVEGWGDYYSNEAREQSGRIIEVQQMQVPCLGGLNPEELSYIAEYNGLEVVR